MANIKKELLLIRHGQSTGNAGEPTENHRLMPLTELGKEEALKVAQRLVFTPQKIIISPLVRTKETSMPTIEKYPLASVEYWHELREFTYIDPFKVKGMTSTERRPFVLSYWQRKDPDYLDGECAETFSDLTARTIGAFHRIMTLAEEKIVIFSHEQFLKSLDLYLQEPYINIKERMDKFFNYPHIANCEQIHIQIGDNFTSTSRRIPLEL